MSESIHLIYLRLYCSVVLPVTIKWLLSVNSVLRAKKRTVVNIKQSITIGKVSTINQWQKIYNKRFSI